MCYDSLICAVRVIGRLGEGLDYYEREREKDGEGREREGEGKRRKYNSKCPVCADSKLCQRWK